MTTCSECGESFGSEQSLRAHFGAKHDIGEEARRLAESQNWRCCYCGCRMVAIRKKSRSATRDHVIPRALGGSDVWWNLVAACARCNHLRQYMDAFGFWRLMRGEDVTKHDLWPDRFGDAA